MDKGDRTLRIALFGCCVVLAWVLIGAYMQGQKYIGGEELCEYLGYDFAHETRDYGGMWLEDGFMVTGRVTSCCNYDETLDDCIMVKQIRRDGG